MNASLPASKPSRRRPVVLALVAGLIGCLAVLLPASSASAFGVWCAGDPIILVNGTVVDVTVSIPLDRLSSVKSVDVTYHVPKNSTAIVVNDSLLYPATVRVVKDQPAVRLGISKVKIPVDISVRYTGSSFPIGATVVSLGGTKLWLDGNASTPMHMTTWTPLGIHLGLPGL